MFTSVRLIHQINNLKEESNVVINVKIMATNPKMVELGFLVIFNFFLTLAYIDWNFQSEHPLSMLS